MRASILITDGDQRAALAAARSLGRAGHRVYVCSTRARSLAGASRHVQAEARVADPLQARDAYVSAIDLLVRRWAIDVLLPITDASLLALLPARDRLAGVHIPFPSVDLFRRVCDKAAVLEAAAEVGIATPEQIVVDASCPDPIEVTLPFPLVVKPTRSVIEGGSRRMKLQVHHATDAASFRSALAALPDEAYPLLLQRRIEGPGVGVFLLPWNGELLAAFAHRRIREKPPGGGVSVYRESVPLEPALLERSVALLERLGWQGVAMVEYKLDARTGTPYLMEVNGRLWGSLQLAIDAGIDFPALLVAAALGARPEPVHRYLTGVRSRWWWGDVDHLLARLRKSPLELGLPPGSDGRARALGEFLVLWRPGDRSEILRFDDPRPFLRETADWLRTALNGRSESHG